ncbi:PAP_fibrillin domain-containing protein, partial [Haematococcus lacustris]
AREVREVQRLVAALTAACRPPVLSWAPLGHSSLDQLQGCWRLLYTSGFNTGSLGGQRPGPPAALVPVALGQIYQVIDASQARLDNVVEFLLPALPLLGSEEGGPVLRLTLGHEYQVQGARSLQIVYESTQAQLLGAPHGLSQLPSWALPQLPPFLQPPRSMR